MGLKKKRANRISPRRLLYRIHEFEAENFQLRQRVEQLEAQVQKLIAQLKQNSQNSSRPPSSDLYHEKSSRSPSEKRRGGQPGHEGHSRNLKPAEEVDETIPVAPTHCEHCGFVLDPGSLKLFLRHQVSEIRFLKALLKEWQLHEGTCGKCGQMTRAVLPAGVPTGALGPEAQARIISATGEYGLSKRKTCRMMKGWFGLDLSAALVCATEKNASQALVAGYEEAKTELEKASRANVDETGFRESWKKNYLWAAVAPRAVVFHIDGHRSREARKKLLGNFKGIPTTDRYSVYGDQPPQFRQICLAHLIRDFRSFLDRGPSSKKIGEALGKVMQATFHRWHEVKAGKKSFKSFQEEIKRYQELLHGLLWDGQFCADEKTATPCSNLLGLEDAIWTFARIPGLDPTNNAAERALRPAVIYRKTSYGTQSETGSRFQERIMTVVATLRQNQQDVLRYLRQTMQAWLQRVAPASLFPQPVLIE